MLFLLSWLSRWKLKLIRLPPLSFALGSGRNDATGKLRSARTSRVIEKSARAFSLRLLSARERAKIFGPLRPRLRYLYGNANEKCWLTISAIGTWAVISQDVEAACFQKILTSVYIHCYNQSMYPKKAPREKITINKIQINMLAQCK